VGEHIIWYLRGIENAADLFVSGLVDEIMGSVCSKIPNQTGVTEIIKVQQHADLADFTVQANQTEQSTLTIEEDQCFQPKVVPSYSWLVSPPVDFDATAKEVNEKAKEELRSEKINDVEYCNSRFVKFCQHSTTSLASLNMKQRT